MKFEIKNRFDGSILFSIEAENWRVAVAAAVGAKANLSSADLRSADLRFANLRSADLRSADLRSANLSFANLRSADLRSADLRSADLRFADLRFANLSFADLSSADLGSANLGSAQGLEKFPISIMGHRHSMFTTSNGKLAIGCHVHSFEQWMLHAEEIGKAENYSPLDIEIYKLHIAHLAMVSRLLWNKKVSK